jgi:hypothetical protein
MASLKHLYAYFTPEIPGMGKEYKIFFGKSEKLWCLARIWNG